MLNQVELGIFNKFLFHLRAKLYFGMVQSLLLTLKYSNLYKSVYKKESPDKSLNCLSKRFFYNDAKYMWKCFKDGFSFCFSGHFHDRKAKLTWTNSKLLRPRNRKSCGQKQKLISKPKIFRENSRISKHENSMTTSSIRSQI